MVRGLSQKTTVGTLLEYYSYLLAVWLVSVKQKSWTQVCLTCAQNVALYMVPKHNIYSKHTYDKLMGALVRERERVALSWARVDRWSPPWFRDTENCSVKGMSTTSRQVSEMSTDYDMVVHSHRSMCTSLKFLNQTSAGGVLSGDQSSENGSSDLAYQCAVRPDSIMV